MYFTQRRSQSFPRRNRIKQSSVFPVQLHLETGWGARQVSREVQPLEASRGIVKIAKPIGSSAKMLCCKDGTEDIIMEDTSLGK